MTHIAPKDPFGPQTTSSPRPWIAPTWLAPSVPVALTVGLMAWVTFSTAEMLLGILAAGAAGFVIGWVRQAFSRRSRFGESLISTLFGAGMSGDPLRLVFLDLFIRTMAGLGVGVLFAQFGVLDAGVANQLMAQLIGGAGGGHDLAGFEFAAFLLLLAAMVGLLVALAFGQWANVALNLLDPGTIGKLSAGGATKSMVKDAVIAQWDGYRWRIGLGRTAAKGAVTGVLTGALLLLAGLKP